MRKRGEGGVPGGLSGLGLGRAAAAIFFIPSVFLFLFPFS